MITVNQTLPNFTLESDEKELITPEKMKGAWAVLYLYPKDDTPGCTQQACSVRDSFVQILHLGVQLYGISPDSVKKHQNFKRKYNLPFPLLADVDHGVAELFGIWREKILFGHHHMGVVRSTVIIDPQGVVRGFYEDVKPENHGEFILSKLRQLLAF